MPPRHGKSELICRYFPAWYLGLHPERNVILTSYEQKQASKYGRLSRNLIDEHGGRVFGGVHVAQDSSAADNWRIEGRDGGMTSVGIGGPLTGKGADLLIVDDPIKNAEQALSEAFRDAAWEWWQSTAFTRLEPNAAIVIVQTRWHSDDLVGRCLNRQRDENWTRIRLPALAELDGDPLGREPNEALWPERFGQKALERIRDGMDAYWWLSLYQQTPSRHESVEWPAHHFEDHIYFEQWPENIGLKVIALDPSKGRDAKHGDYSAFAKLAVTTDGHLYVEMDLARRPPGEIITDGVEHFRTFRPDGFVIESNAWQDLLGGMFESAMREINMLAMPVALFDNRVKKEVRIRRLGAFFDRLHVRNTPGGRLFVQQLREFPVAAHDDGPDALEMAVRYAAELLDTVDDEQHFDRIIT